MRPQTITEHVSFLCSAFQQSTTHFWTLWRHASQGPICWNVIWESNLLERYLRSNRRKYMLLSQSEMSRSSSTKAENKSDKITHYKCLLAFSRRFCHHGTNHAGCCSLNDGCSIKTCMLLMPLYIIYLVSSRLQSEVIFRFKICRHFK